MNGDEESKLIADCLRGAAEAWNSLFLEHYAPAARFIFQLSPYFSREDAEEICQETFLSVVRHLASFEGGCRLQTWIFRVARNKARDHQERQSAAKRGGGRETISLQDHDDGSEIPVDPPSHDPGPRDQLIAAEEQAALGRVLQQLDEPCRELIDLRYFGDLSYEEIAVISRLNVKTVSSRLSRCLDRLEAILSGVSRGKSRPLPSNQKPADTR